MIYEKTTCIEHLLDQYEETLEQTNECIEKLEKKIESISKIFDDKTKSKSARLKAKEATGKWQHDLNIYRSSRTSLEFAINWMKTGHPPGNIRGVERRAAYEKEKPIDPLLMQRYFRSQEPTYSWDDHEQEHVITPSEKQVIDAAMSSLSPKELEVFLMFKGYSFSQYKIAEMMGISRSSVKTMINRANKKVSKILQESKEGICS